MSPNTIFGVSNVEPSQNNLPWFTGPLLTPSARVISEGHINIEPYFFWTVINGRYDDHGKREPLPSYNQINTQLQVKWGIAENLDLTTAIQSFASHSKGQSSSSFGDIPFGFDYQIFKGDPGDWLSYAKISIIEVFPIGKFEGLDPDNFGTDVSGQGSFLTNIGLTISKLFPFPSERYLGFRCSASASFATPTHVNGINIYGGGPQTRGTVYPGTAFNLLAAVEYTLTKEFVLACDFQAQYGKRSRFKGFTEIPVREPENFQFSFAPALEYNLNSSMGFIVGTWFTVAGKNSLQFISGIAAFNYSY